MESENGMRRSCIIDAVDFGRDLPVEGPVADGVPSIAAGCRDALHLLLERDRQWFRAIWHENPLHEAQRSFRVPGPLELLKPVGHDVGMIADFFRHQGSGPRMNPAAPHTASTAVAASDHIGQIQGVARELSHFRANGLKLRVQFLFHPLHAPRLRQIDFPLSPLHPRKDSAQTVVLLLRNGIQLVVMTARAVDGDGGCGGHDLRNNIIQITSPCRAPELFTFGLHVAHKIPGACGKKTSRYSCFRIFGLEHVACNLLPEKNVVRLVLVECFDDVVAISPCIRTKLVALETVRVGVVRNIQPVPRPAFAVTRAGKKFIHEHRVGVGSWIVHKRLHALRRGRQPKQIKGKPADQRASVRLRGPIKSGLEQRLSDKIIDVGFFRPHALDLLHGPVGVAFVDGGLFCSLLRRPGRSLLDPILQPADFRCGKRLPLGWHALVLALRIHARQQQTMGRIAGHDRRSIFTSCDHCSERIQTESTLLLPRVMALPAALSENRLYFCAEIHRMQRVGCEPRATDKRHER